MRRLGAAGVFAATALAALAWAGDEPKTHAIDWRERWKAGQTVTVTVHETRDFETIGGPAAPPKQLEVLDVTYVVRCDAADADGTPTKRMVFVKSFRHSQGPNADGTISGELFTVTGTTWSRVGATRPGSEAMKGLDDTFRKPRDGPFSALSPPRMAVGQTWKPDAKAVAAAFKAPLGSTPFDATLSTMEITLRSAEGTPPDVSGRFAYKAHLPVAAVPFLPQGAKVRAGSGAEVVGERTGPLASPASLGVERMDVELSVFFDTAKEAGGEAVGTKGRSSRTKTTVAGGEIPEAPKPAPPAPGGK